MATYYADGTQSGYADETPQEASDRAYREREYQNRMQAMWDRFHGRKPRTAEEIQNHRAQWCNG